MPPSVRTQQTRTVQLESLTLADGLATTKKLSSNGAWTKLRFRLSATTSGGTPTGLSRFEGLAVLNRLRLRAGGRPVFDLTPGEVYRQQMILNGMRPERIAATTTPGAWSYSFEINFELPPPYRYPRSGITVFPAAILPNIELEIICPASLMGALYTGVSTTIFSVGPQLTVTAEIIDVPDQKLAQMVLGNKLHGYQQLQQSDQPTATGNRDIPLVAGEGIMNGLFVSNANGTVPGFSDAMAGDTFVILGANEFVSQSRFLEIQNRAREGFMVPDPVIFTGLNTTGAWFLTYAPHGALGEGIDLQNQQSLKLRQSIDVLTNSVGVTNVIQHILIPGYWRTIARTGIVAQVSA